MAIYFNEKRGDTRHRKRNVRRWQRYRRSPLNFSNIIIIIRYRTMLMKRQHIS